MVCIGRKAQVLVRRGMDIRRGNHPSSRGAFSAVLTRVANTSPSPGRRRVWTSSSQLRSPGVPGAGSSRGAGCSGRSSGCGTLEAVPLVRIAGNSGWSADTSAPGSPLRWLCPPPPSPPLPPASPQGIPTPPGYNQPIRHRPKSAAFQSFPGFAQRIFFNSDSLCRIYLFGILEVDGRVKGEPAIPCPGDGGFGEV